MSELRLCHAMISHLLCPTLTSGTEQMTALLMYITAYISISFIASKHVPLWSRMFLTDSC